MEEARRGHLSVLPPSTLLPSTLPLVTATGYYGLDHPNPRGTANADGRYWGRQHRRDEFSGGVVVHSAEVPPDYVLPDLGAENTARYFTGSDRPASYHRIADSDSIVRFLPFDHEAYHDGTGGNRWSVGVSMGTQARTWGTNPAHDDRMLRNAARAIAEAARYWASLAPGRDPLRVARWITPEQYRAKEPGLVEHGQLDPSRRSDPWTTHRLRPELRDRLVDYVRAELAGDPVPEPTPDPEELTVADIKVILDRLDAQDAAIAALTDRVDALAVGTSYQGHPHKGVVQVLADLDRHVSGAQDDDKKTLRSIVEATYNKVT